MPGPSSWSEARSGDPSARGAEKFSRLHFSVIRMGSRGTFVLCTDVRGSMKYSPHLHLTICMHSPPQTKPENETERSPRQIVSGNEE